MVKRVRKRIKTKRRKKTKVKKSMKGGGVFKEYSLDEQTALLDRISEVYVKETHDFVKDKTKSFLEFLCEINILNKSKWLPRQKNKKLTEDINKFYKDPTTGPTTEKIILPSNKAMVIEDIKKKIVDDVTGKQIAERVKYTCVFFDDNKTEFKDVILYESMLTSYKDIFIAKMDGETKSKESDYKSLIKEASEYTVPNYNYGNIIYFKTKKFEIFKKRSSVKTTKPILSKEEMSVLTDEEKKVKLKIKRNETIQYVVNYSTPEFILSGIKKENHDNLFYPNGDIKKIVSEVLYKVKWFNSNQMKFSEIYLPAECFTDNQPFKTKVLHNSETKDK